MWTFAHSPAQMSPPKASWHSPIGGKYIDAPISSLSNAKFMADIEKREPCENKAASLVLNSQLFSPCKYHFETPPNEEKHDAETLC